jgi:hypothetical protein
MLVKRAARFVNWLTSAATRRRGAHDLLDAHFRSTPVIGGHVATHITLGDDADELEPFGILNHRRAAAA